MSLHLPISFLNGSSTPESTPGVGVGSTKVEGGRNFEPLDMLIHVQTWPHDHCDHAMLFRGPRNSEDWPEQTLMDMNLEKANHAKQRSDLSAAPFHPSFSSELPSWRGTRIGRSRGKARASFSWVPLASSSFLDFEYLLCRRLRSAQASSFLCCYKVPVLLVGPRLRPYPAGPALCMLTW